MKPRIILKIHLVFLAITTLNLIGKIFFDFSLLPWIDNSFKLILVITGIWIFFKNLNPFNSFNLYFIIYPLIIGFGIIALIFRGIIGLIILSSISFLFNFNETEYIRDDIRLYSDAKGFMSRCCSYKVTESKLLICEKIL